MDGAGAAPTHEWRAQRTARNQQRGDRYLRTLLIDGGRAVLRFAALKRNPRSRWIEAAKERRSANIAAVALTN